MKTICLYFEIHQIIHLKRYRCFDIGRDHYYYDDYENERGISDIAERSYIPALSALIEMAKNHGDTFKVALSISGVALEQLEVHAPGFRLQVFLKRDSFMKRILLAIIRFYRTSVSPLTASHCKYIPTCSQYGIEAIERFGALKGTALTVWRILRCNPFSKGGYDPVPEKKPKSKKLK